MATVNRAMSYLDEHHVPYECLPHSEAYTSQGVAAASHVSGWRVAKVLLVHEDRGTPFMVVLPAARQLDLHALQERTHRPSLSLATEKQIEQLFPDCETGALPPFGHLYGMTVYVDSCFTAPEIAFQPGNHHELVRMRYEDFIQLAHPIVADVCRH